MGLDAIIRGGMVVRGSGVERLDVGIASGTIAELAPEIRGQTREEIDATGLHVFPGVIDAHVHFNEPGRTEWEGFATGSAALAAGGGTCFVEMPLNAHPPTLDGASFDLKLAAARGKCRTDFAFWGGLTPANLDRMEELAGRGVVGFKAFMCNTGIDDFLRADDLTLLRGMEIAARLGLPVAVHAESEELVAALTSEARRNGRTSVRDYMASRPIVAEVDAIRRAILYAQETGCSVHIVHISSPAGSMEVVESRHLWRREGTGAVEVTGETCPHYLLMNEADVERLGAVAKCSPPLHPEPERAALVEQVRTGGIDTVGSDHSPAPKNMKESPDFFGVWGGISGVQLTLRAMLSLGLPFEVLARVLSENVGKRFRLPGKGAIVVGRDADVVLVDVGVTAYVQRDELLDRHRLSPYIGRRLAGRVLRTMVRGHTVWADGRLVGEPVGRLVKPECGPA